MAREIYNIASSGLMLAQRALNTSSHNISNANVEGYSRQRLETSGIPEVSASGTASINANITGTVTRAFDGFIQHQIRTESSTVNSSDIYHQMASRIDDFIADPDTNLTGPMNDMFSSLQDIVTDPNSSAARIAMLDHAEVTTQRFVTLNDQLKTLHDQVNNELTSNVDEVNTLAKNIASLNTQIVDAYNLPNVSPPNDLMDQRDKMLQELSEKIDMNTNTTDKGAINVFIGYGQSLVSGGNYNQLKVADSDYNPDDKNIMLTMDNHPPLNISSTLTGGKLGGLLKLNREVLDPTTNQLGQLAAGFSLAFNEQHTKGIDLNGTQGTNLFTDYTDVNNNKDNWHENINNKGIAKLDVTFDNAADNNYKNLIPGGYNLQFKDDTYTLTRLNDNTIFTSSDGSFKVDGLNIKLAAEPPENGDSYLITPFAHVANDLKILTKDPAKVAAASPGFSGTADNTNMIELSKLQTEGTLGNGKNTFQKTYTQMVTWVGGRTRNADINVQSHQSLLKQLNEQRQNISGVNLDEEAANLLQFQQAYQASAQIIPIANSMFEALLSAVR